MQLHWNHPLSRTIVALGLAALGPVAAAQPAQDVSATRRVFTSGSAEDFDTGIGDEDSDEITSNQATGLFDETVQVSLTDPNEVAGVEGLASQTSNISFVSPQLVQITGEMAIANQFLSLASNSDWADVVVYSETGLSFRMTTDLPVMYTICVDYAVEFEGSTGGPSDALVSLHAFDVSESVGGGEGAWNFSGEVSPGEHLVSLALIHTATDVQPHSDIFAGGTVNFDVTAQIVPTPASGLTLTMLVGLLLRRRRERALA